MRAEWARTKAHAERWEEEVELLVEEMHRVVAYFEWAGGYWAGLKDRRATGTSTVPFPTDVADGIQAYASKRAAHFRGLAAKCARRWVPLFTTIGRPPSWGEKYGNLCTNEGEDGGSSDEDE